MGANEKPREAVTIVGGRPMHRAVPVEELPQGVEQVLTVAALDRRFRDEVARDPVAAATRKGIRLDEIEATLLRSTRPERLVEMARRLIIPPGVDRRSFVKAVSASVVALVTGKAMLLCSGCTGADSHWEGDEPDASTEPDQRWMNLGGHTCYAYIPASLVSNPGWAPLLIALHGEDETCLASVQRWHTAADNGRFYLLAVNWTEEATTPETQAQLIADLYEIMRQFQESYDVSGMQRFITGRGQSTALAWQAAYVDAPTFAGAVLLGGVPPGDWVGNALALTSQMTATPALYYVMGTEDAEYAAATACYEATVAAGAEGYRKEIVGSTNDAVLDFSDIWSWIYINGLGSR